MGSRRVIVAAQCAVLANVLALVGCAGEGESVLTSPNGQTIASDEPGPPTAAPGTTPRQVRPPPGPDGSVPPEPDPEAVAAEQAEVDERYRLRDSEVRKGKRILTTDAGFRALLDGISYEILASGPWGEVEDRIGMFFDIRLAEPLSNQDAEIPVLVRSDPDDCESPLTERSSFRADLRNIKKMTVLVRFTDDAVVDVLPELEGTSTMRGGPPDTCPHPD